MQLWKKEASEIAHLVATRQVSCVEVVRDCMDRMDAVNPVINAIVESRREQVLHHARRADRAVATGVSLGSLHGVPFTVKVNVDQAGFATTNGVPEHRDHMAQENSAVVQNMLNAGAIPIGRTNAPAFSMRWFTDNDLHGRTLNPCGSALTPGGSSGGAAAAVAAGIGPIAHGNDQGGSIRYPAYACGVYGLRPTQGRVPAFNPSAALERPPAIQVSSVQGPLARSVADIRLALHAMSARDPRDPTWVDVPFKEPKGAHRVALFMGAEGREVDPEVKSALRQAGAWLEAAGYDVVELAPPRFQEAATLWADLTMNDTRSFMEKLILGGKDVANKNSYRSMLANSAPFDLDRYLRATAERTAMQRAWSLFFEDFPLLLLPTSMRRPFNIDDDQSGVDRMREILDAQSPMLATAILGLPGLAVPMGMVAGVPTGIQLVSGRFQELHCLRAAEVIEARRGPVSPIDPVA